MSITKYNITVQWIVSFIKVWLQFSFILVILISTPGTRWIVCEINTRHFHNESKFNRCPPAQLPRTILVLAYSALKLTAVTARRIFLKRGETATSDSTGVPYCGQNKHSLALIWCSSVMRAGSSPHPDMTTMIHWTRANNGRDTTNTARWGGLLR